MTLIQKEATEIISKRVRVTVQRTEQFQKTLWTNQSTIAVSIEIQREVNLFNHGRRLDKTKSSCKVCQQLKEQTEHRLITDRQSIRPRERSEIVQ